MYVTQIWAMSRMTSRQLIVDYSVDFDLLSDAVNVDHSDSFFSTNTTAAVKIKRYFNETV